MAQLLRGQSFQLGSSLQEPSAVAQKTRTKKSFRNRLNLGTHWNDLNKCVSPLPGKRVNELALTDVLLVLGDAATVPGSDWWEPFCFLFCLFLNWYFKPPLFCFPFLPLALHMKSVSYFCIFPFAHGGKPHPHLRRTDTTRQTPPCGWEPQPDTACGTERGEYVCVCGYKWEIVLRRVKAMLELNAWRKVCVQSGNKEMNVFCFVYQELFFSENCILLLETISLFPLHPRGCCHSNIPSPQPYKTESCPRTRQNWKFWMKKNPSGDKLNTCSVVLPVITYPATYENSVSNNKADVQNNAEMETVQVS